MGFRFSGQQQAVIENRGGPLLVSAAAGSGKTTVLVERLLTRILQEEVDIDRFLIITYTKAAAAELRGKIARTLSERLAEDPGSRHLRRQSALIYQAQISTIHSFCQSVLRDHSHLADLDPDFRVADDNECAVLKENALNAVLNRHYTAGKSDSAFTALSDAFSVGYDDRELRRMILDIYEKVQSDPYPLRWLELRREDFTLEGIRDLSETAWGRCIMDHALSQLECSRHSLAGLLDVLEDSQYQAVLSGCIDNDLEELDSLCDSVSPGCGSWIDAGRHSEPEFKKYPTIRGNEEKALREYVKSVRDECKARTIKAMEPFRQSSEELIGDLKAISPAVFSLLDIVREFHAEFQRAKSRRKLVDFSDLEHFTVDLLTGENGEPTDTAKRLSDRYVEVMVDEYQDTNLVQNTIFSAVSDCGSKLFMVGDIKQSIYRFRQADPTIFAEKLVRYPLYDDLRILPGQPRKILLSCNYRSRKEVLDACNFIFRSLMTEKLGEVDYNEEHYLNLGRTDFPESDKVMTEFHVVERSDEDLPEGEDPDDADALEAEYIAGVLHDLKASGQEVTEGNGLRAAEWGDFCVLARSMGVMLPYITSALDAANIPWQADGGADFFAQVEVSTAVNFLQIIDNPHQDIPLISVLRCPVYAFTPDMLASIRAAGRRDDDFFTCLHKAAESGNAACSRFMEDLNRLRFRSADLSAADLLWEIFESTGMLSLYRALSGGELRRDNLLFLYEYARRFDSGGQKGVFTFTSHLTRLRKLGKSIGIASARPGNGVRLMTIHKSKGLEFPVVLLCGLGRRFNTSDEKKTMLFHPKLGVGPRGIDPEKRIRYNTIARSAVSMTLARERCSEELRVLYVAMTRAVDKLVMIDFIRARGKDPDKLKSNASFPMDPSILGEMSCIGDWVLSAVLARPEASGLLENFTVRRRFLEKDSAWKIIRRKYSPVLSNDGKTAAAAVSHSEEKMPDLSSLTWKYPHASVPGIPSKLTVTQLKGRIKDSEISEGTSVPAGPISFRRPDFIRKSGLTATEAGTALHLFMQLCDPDAASSREGVCSELTRLTAMGCMTKEQANACTPSLPAAFFSSPLGIEARKCGMNREFKFNILRDAEEYFGKDAKGEQVLLQGVVDLWFRSDKGITVVDFKTDRVTEATENEKAEAYRIQLEQYSKALECILDEPVVHRYLWFFRTGHSIEIT